MKKLLLPVALAAAGLAVMSPSAYAWDVRDTRADCDDASVSLVGMNGERTEIRAESGGNRLAERVENPRGNVTMGVNYSGLKNGDIVRLIVKLGDRAPISFEHHVNDCPASTSPPSQPSPPAELVPAPPLPEAEFPNPVVPAVPAEPRRRRTPPQRGSCPDLRGRVYVEGPRTIGPNPDDVGTYRIRGSHVIRVDVYVMGQFKERLRRGDRTWSVRARNLRGDEYVRGQKAVEFRVRRSNGCDVQTDVVKTEINNLDP